MTKKELEKKIKNAIDTLAVERSGLYSVKNLEKIANEAKCDTYYVMMFLRYGQIL